MEEEGGAVEWRKCDCPNVRIRSRRDGKPYIASEGQDATSVRDFLSFSLFLFFLLSARCSGSESTKLEGG